MTLIVLRKMLTEVNVPMMLIVLHRMPCDADCSPQEVQVGYTGFTIMILFNFFFSGNFYQVFLSTPSFPKEGSSFVKFFSIQSSMFVRTSQEGVL